MRRSSGCSGGWRKRCSRLALRESLDNPHPDALGAAEEGFDAWARGLPEEDAEGLLDPKAGVPVRWVRGKGFVKARS